MEGNGRRAAEYRPAWPRRGHGDHRPAGRRHEDRWERPREAGAAPDDTRAPVVTIGSLARRTGLSVKALRRYADIGLIYTAGRSPANYRLFDESALWCVGVIRNLRSLGLTVREIRELVAVYLGQPDRPIGRYLAERLRASRARVDARIAELEALRRRIDDFEARHAAALADRPGADFRAEDPRFRAAS